MAGAALAGRADGTDIHNTDTAFPDYRQKFETGPVKNSVETILSIGKSLASLREQAANIRGRSGSPSEKALSLVLADDNGAASLLKLRKRIVH